MHQPSDYHDRIEAENGQIVRILTAEWVDKRHGNDVYYCDVYKESDDGEAWSQNLYCSMWGGHTVCFPGLPRNDRKNSWYYDPSIAEEEGFTSMGRLSTVGWSDPVTKAEEELVISFYPDFKYVLKKYKMKSKSELMEKLRKWIPHHEVELILAAGFEKVAMNGSFWRLSEKNRKETCLFMRQNPQFKELNLREIREAMRSNDPVDYARYLEAIPYYHRSKNPSAWYPCISYEDYKYMKRQQKKFKSSYDDEKHAFNELINIYNDYIRMLFRSDHNCHDEYWRWPSDIQIFHDRLEEEERIKREAERIAEAERERLRQIERVKKDKKRAKVAKAIEKKFKSFCKTIDGYSIFVTSDYDEWQKQAKALEQCICAAGYYQQMADGKCTIVFIQKEGEPVATAQIMPDGSLNQFYANEHDRDNCLPTPEVKAAFEKWKAAIPKSKFTRIKKAKKEEKTA